MTRHMIVLLALIASPAFSQTDPRVALGLVPPDVMEGARLFQQETFGGNGRTCATCHAFESNGTLEQSDIDALPFDAPLFATNVPGLEHPSFIRRGLVLENLDGFDADPNFRSIPHMFSLATSIVSTVDQPAGSHAVGWSGDGAPAPGTLRDFARGAVTQHFTRSLERRPGIDFRLPTPEEEDALLAFQMSLGRVEDIALENVRFADSQAERGRPLMLDSVNNNCQRCHASAGASRGLNGGGFERLGPDGAITGNQNKDTNVDVLRQMGVPPDHGRGVPGDETFSPPPLIEAADSAPFFHNNAAGIIEIEDAVRFYTVRVGLFSGQQQNLDEGQVQDLGAVLRSLNASFNAQLAVQRLDAALLVAEFAPTHSSVGELLDLAAEEAEDGARVLRSPGSQQAKDSLAECGKFARLVSTKHKPAKHTEQIEKARAACAAANDALGSGLTMKLGPGNLAVRSSRFQPNTQEESDAGQAQGQADRREGNGAGGRSLKE